MSKGLKIEQWQEIKNLVSDTILQNGGSISCTALPNIKSSKTSFLGTWVLTLFGFPLSDSFENQRMNREPSGSAGQSN